MEHAIKFGSRADFGDERDDRHIQQRYLKKKHPLTDQDAPVTQQLPLNSCTANAVAAAMWYMQPRDRKLVRPCRMFLHYHALLFQRNQNMDEDEDYFPSLESTAERGVSIRNVLKAALRFGTPEECYWPHPELSIPDFRVEGEPEDLRYLCDKARSHALRVSPGEDMYQATRVRGLRVASYERLDHADCETFLAPIENGYPVLFSFRVAPSFQEAGTTGRMPVPSAEEEADPLGKHTMVAVRVDRDKRTVRAQNSFGGGWGFNGFVHIPFEFFDGSHVLNAWVVTEVERIGRF